MIKNSYISLEPKSKVRLDAVNTLKYTLFLERQTVELDDLIEAFDDEDAHQDDRLQKFFSSLMEATQLCCRGLFEDGVDGTIYYWFFGRQEKKATSNLAYLDNYPPISNSGAFNGMAGFHTMILQHCILSSYHAVLTDLLKDHRVTPYEMENKIGMKGIHSLYKEGKISFTDKGLKYCDRQKDVSKKNSGKASDFTNKTKTHIKWMPHIMELFVESKGKTSYRYHSQFLQTCYYICGITALDFRFLKYDERKKRKIGTLLASIENLTNELEPKVDLDKAKLSEKIFGNFNGDIVDGLYHYYITERVFNLNLFYALAKNIQFAETQTSYRLCQDSIIQALTCCRDLPNVFSRQYFLKYAFDKIKDEPVSYFDFWHMQNMMGSGVMMRSNEGEVMCFDFGRWVKQFKAFMGYMSKFMIPVYEWCFMDILLGVIEKMYPEKAHIFHLESAFKMLSRYMENNYRSILQPIKFKSEMDIVALSSKHKNAEYIVDYLPHDSLRQMVDALIRSDNSPDGVDKLELNLHALNPSFFDDRSNNPRNNTYKKLRNLYTNCVRNMCLE